MRPRILALMVLVTGPAIAVLALLGWFQSLDESTAVDLRPSRDDATPGLFASLDLAGGRLLRPGPLARAHSGLEGITACMRCHGAGSEVQDARCLACHAEVGLRAERDLPLHGTFEDSCASCHADHRGIDAPLIELDRAAFQHDRTRFPLRGRHLEVSCEGCHDLVADDAESASFYYQGVPFGSCVQCHADPHAGDRPTPAHQPQIRRVAFDGPAALTRAWGADDPVSAHDCGSCHTDASFRSDGLVPGGFDHEANTTFPLRGAHRGVSCVSCHTEERRSEEILRSLAPGTGAGESCEDCHEDPHHGVLDQRGECEKCHTSARWSQGFEHDTDARFLLDELHSRLACTGCHEDLRFRSAGRECHHCHPDAAALLAGSFDLQSGAPDPHFGAVKCTGCHGPTIESNRTPALSAACAECHPASYRSLVSTWQKDLDAAARRSRLAPGEKTRLQRTGLHNFLLARELLEGALAAGKSAGSTPRRPRSATAHSPLIP